MKRNALVIISLACLAIVSSCSYKVYPVPTLEFNYDVRMTSPEELKAKSNIHIFQSEEEVGNEYEVLAYVNYRPAIVMPIFAPERSQQLKNFYKKAVMKADELGGNGVILISVGSFKVINIPSLKEVEAAEAPKVSPILQSAVLGTIEGSDFINVDSKKQTRYITMLEDEIKSNLKACKTLEEASFIERKIDALSSYYGQKGKISKGMEKTIEGYRAALTAVEKKIEAKATKAGQKAGKVSEKATNTVNSLKSKAKALIEK